MIFGLLAFYCMKWCTIKHLLSRMECHNKILKNQYQKDYIKLIKDAQTTSKIYWVNFYQLMLQIGQLLNKFKTMNSFQQWTGVLYHSGVINVNCNNKLKNLTLNLNTQALLNLRGYYSCQEILLLSKIWIRFIKIKLINEQ